MAKSNLSKSAPVRLQKPNISKLQKAGPKYKWDPIKKTERISPEQLNDIAVELRGFIKSLGNHRQSGKRITLGQIAEIEAIASQLEEVIGGQVPKFWYTGKGRVPAVLTLSSVQEGLSKLQMGLMAIAGEINRQGDHLGTMSIDSQGQAMTGAAFAPKPGSLQRQLK